MAKITISNIIALSCVAFAALVALNESLNSLALYVAIPVAFLISFLRYNVIQTNRYVRLLMILYLWVVFCYPFAEELQLAMLELKRIMGAFLLSYILGALAKTRKLIPWLYLIFILLLVMAWEYAKNNILMSIEFGDERLSDENLNANTLAYYTFYVTMAIYLLGEILKHQKVRSLFRVLFFGMFVLSFVTAVYTGSRQVLIIQIPLLASLIVVRYVRFSITHILVAVAVVLVALMAYKQYGESIYESSTLKQRNEVTSSDDIRFKLVSECIDLGLQRPLLGYGPGNSVKQISTGHFAHNTFLELLVNCGFPGMFIFTYMILIFLKTQYRRWKATKDRMFLSFLLFGIFWTIDQMFYVFYTQLWLISFFILIATHSDMYYNTKYLKSFGCYDNTRS